MRLAVIGDVHANLHALDAVLAEAARRGATSILCLGDLVGYCAHPDAVCRRLREAGVDVVQGNYDDAVGCERDDCGCGACCGDLARLRAASLAWSVAHTNVETKAWLRALPPRRDLTVAGRRLAAFHGGPAALNEEFGPGDLSRLDAILADTGAGVLLLGHSHRPWSLRRPGGLVLNPGSVGKPLGTPHACRSPTAPSTS